MGRSTLRAAAVVTLAALLAGTTATASYAAAPAAAAPAAAAPAEGVTAPTPPTPVDLTAGRYIVLLDEAPAATYDGGESGLRRTAPAPGAKLDARSPQVAKYSAFLEERQEDVAASAGVTTDGNLTIALNGFTANLSASQAKKLAGTGGVQAVVPDEIRHPDAVPSTEFLGLEGDAGVWNAVGGIDAAGAGTVVGIIDTGIAPENPSFAGEPLGTIPSGDASGEAEPYLDGNTVVFEKADGGTFKSERVAGEAWNNDDYSTKIVGAKYFSTGAAGTGYDFAADFLSPRDGDGHGSHTGSTAAGNNAVDASVNGVSFGQISGVAPAAKVASYKACYSGPDDSVNTDDICASSDLVTAIDTAAKDGVDVINYSIGGGAATSTLTIEDVAFFNAAGAGIFVAVSAGNDGPGASTADHASPWYTTVAASTVPTYEGTVTLASGFVAAGASISVPFGEQVTGPVVYSGDIPAAGVAAASAALCEVNSVDAAQAAGKIVVCDRGGNARTQKSEVVKAAGGIGMILVNVTPGSLDNDFHSVPTIHLQNTVRDALLAAVRAGTTATLLSENITGVETPTPVVAGFSSRGPMLADGSDILKPDISAPGVAILAATENDEGADPTFNFLSGTSMSSPHIAGLAALYLGERPNASPAEVKSAMMTTAYNTVNDDGSDNTDPFAQGAGHVDPTRFFDAGLIYNNGPDDWRAFLQGKGLYDSGVEPIDGSDLNIASFAIGSLSGSQTVTRTVTATTGGTFTSSYDLPGFDVTVEPASLTLAAGESATYSVTFTKTTAPAEVWGTGFLTWSSDTQSVRSPVALYPVTVDAPQAVSGTGVTGSTDVSVEPGITGELPLNLGGLAPAVLQVDPELPGVPGHTGDQDSFYEEPVAGSDAAEYRAYFVIDVPEGSQMARFDVNSSDDAGSDLDLNVYRVVSPTDPRYYETWAAATGAADESLVLADPTPGTYLAVVNRYSFTSPFTWDLTTGVVGDGGEGAFTATPNPLPVTEGTPANYALSWTGLAPETRYYGVVQYGDSAVRTILTVDSGLAAAVNTTPPVITGKAKVGKTLTATPGTWDAEGLTFTYQWLRDGQPIEGATATTYRVVAADRGTSLSVRVTAAADSRPSGVADSAAVFVKNTSSVKVTMNRYLGLSSQSFAVTVAVTPAAGAPATGDVSVWVSGKTYTGTLVGGTVTIPLPKQSRGIKVVVAEYGGDAATEASTGVSAFVVFW